MMQAFRQGEKRMMQAFRRREKRMMQVFWRVEERRICCAEKKRESCPEERISAEVLCILLPVFVLG